jgi:hypothetical protein
MKKVIITEEEKKQIRFLYEGRVLSKTDLINMLLRRWDVFKEIYNDVINSSMHNVICTYRRYDDFEGFLKHVNEVVLHTMFYKSFSEEITTHDDYERFIRFGSELISNRFVEEIEKKYNSKHC